MPASATSRSGGPIPLRASLEVAVRERWWRTGEPGVDERLPQRLRGDLPELDEHGRVPVEVRDREERPRLRREHGLLLTEILDPDREDRAVRWSHIAEPLEVGLAERPLPRECLTAHGPGPLTVALAFDGLGQRQGQPGHVVEARHGRTVPRPATAARGSARRWSGRCMMSGMQTWDALRARR